MIVRIIIPSLLLLFAGINILPAQSLPSSAALPRGMTLVWHDEFNGRELDRTKWSTNYYSSLDFLRKISYGDMLGDNLPQPAMEFTGHSIILKVDSLQPDRPHDGVKKISSIQTYDWRGDRNMMPGNIGGYFEARIRRNATPGTRAVNLAFWFDSPGPDLRYYLEQGGHEHDGVQGIRPHGQVFEIDLCEQLNTEIVLHGNVRTKGEFDHNIGHFRIPGDYKDKWVVHGMLWTPAGLRFYIDGRQVAESWDPRDIKAPNHAMVMFFGAYGYDGEATMEVDYVRHYRWALDQGSELPNGGFEYDGALFPWEGGGQVSAEAARTGDFGLFLPPGETVCQYVYADPGREYEVSFHCKSGGRPTALHAQACSIVPVGGEKLLEGAASGSFRVGRSFARNSLTINTRGDHPGNKSTVLVTFTNNGSDPVFLDDVALSPTGRHDITP